MSYMVVLDVKCSRKRSHHGLVTIIPWALGVTMKRSALAVLGLNYVCMCVYNMLLPVGYMNRSVQVQLLGTVYPRLSVPQLSESSITQTP